MSERVGSNFRRGDTTTPLAHRTCPSWRYFRRLIHRFTAPVHCVSPSPNLGGYTCTKYKGVSAVAHVASL